MPHRLQFLPVLASFGPVFIVLGLTIGLMAPRALTSTDVVRNILPSFLFAFCGALMTSAALIILYHEIVSLRQLLEAKTDAHGPTA